MISANEIRIGNHFKNLVIESITKTGVNFSNSYEGYNEIKLESLLPIRLTPQILEEKGFEKDGFDYKIKADDKVLFGFFYENYFVILFNGARFVDLEYLHQFQNLYYDLTGKELENSIPTITTL